MARRYASIAVGNVPVARPRGYHPPRIDIGSSYRHSVSIADVSFAGVVCVDLCDHVDADLSLHNGSDKCGTAGRARAGVERSSESTLQTRRVVSGRISRSPLFVAVDTPRHFVGHC